MPKINFGPGPATLPQEVLQQAAAAITDYNNSGLSILEIPHRGELFHNILAESKSLVKELTGLGDDYEVLWLQGGGRLQFAMVPMNFLPGNGKAGYIDSGHWAYDAQQHAKQYGHVHTLASSRNEDYKFIPPINGPIPDDLAYVHYTTNNTIYGTQWSSVPECSVPLIADMSSDIFSEKRDYSRYDLFYAVAQKNIGAAGVTLVVLRKKNMLDKIVRQLPPILDYRQQVLHDSIINTPPVFNIYVALLMLRFTKAKGIEQIEKETNEKATLLYNEIDRNSLFTPIVLPRDRSKMNVVFKALNESVEKEFLAFCMEHNVEGVSGHRSVGGFRVSLYNGVQVADVVFLVKLMQEFEILKKK